MNFDEETLQEIEDYINALDENIGLESDTLVDIDKAIAKKRKELKNLTKPVVVFSDDECKHRLNCGHDICNLSECDEYEKAEVCEHKETYKKVRFGVELTKCKDCRKILSQT